MTRSLIAPIALACTTLFTAMQAHAVDAVVDGFANGSETVHAVLSAPNAPLDTTPDAGGFRTSINGGPSFTTYCVDLYTQVFANDVNSFTQVGAANFGFANANAAKDLGKLFAEGNVIGNSVAQAAMQIAIWEIAYETTGIYSLGNGAAVFSGGTAATSGALALAGTWLGALSTTSGSVPLTVLSSDKVQDLIFAAPVPEPSTYALMAAGLMSIGFVARRRSVKR
jgi:PEP-CTERM motif